MRLIDAISIIGTLLTAIGTAITLWQASKVRRYRQQIAFDLRKIHLSEVRELLRRFAQDEGRKFLSHVQQLNRGKNVLAITDNIQAYIDRSLNLLHLSGPDSDIARENIAHTQKHSLPLPPNHPPLSLSPPCLLPPPPPRFDTMRKDALCPPKTSTTTLSGMPWSKTAGPSPTIHYAYDGG